MRRSLNSRFCTVRHASGAESIDFDHELVRIYSESESARSSPVSEDRAPSPFDNVMLIRRQKRTIYTLLTDLINLKCVDIIGPRWREISRHLGSDYYTDDMIRNRYIRICRSMECLDTPTKPTTIRRRSYTPTKPTRKWTDAEDSKLLTHLQAYKGKNYIPWETIQENFIKSRTRNAIRNRAYRLGIS